MFNIISIIIVISSINMPVTRNSYINFVLYRSITDRGSRITFIFFPTTYTKRNHFYDFPVCCLDIRKRLKLLLNIGIAPEKTDLVLNL